MLLQDSIPIDKTRVLRVMMVNKLRVDSFDLVDGLDNSHWNVEIFALHYIATAFDDPIGSVVGMSKDQINQHNLSVCRNPTLAKCGGEAQHLEKLEVGSLPGLPKVQRSTIRRKTPRIGAFLVSLERS
jgi:hypothetical protein